MSRFFRSSNLPKGKSSAQANKMGRGIGPGNEKKVARKRSTILGVAMTIFLVICAIQLFSVQIIRGPALAEQGRQVRTSATEIQASRGKIVDSTGQVLVDSVQTYHLAVNQVNLAKWKHYDAKGSLIGEGPEDAAEQLASLLDMDQAELGGMMVGESTYVYLKKNVDAATYRKVKALGIYGIEWEPVYERVYPAGNTAATVVGSVDSEGNGNSGLELIYNDILTGTAGEESYEIGPTGEVIPGAKTTSKEAVDGSTITTSIRADLQSIVQSSLDEAVEQYQADWGSVVVMEVATSRVLVLADSEVADPSEGPQLSKSVQLAFEPGSVGKILTLATALEKGTVNPTTVFTVPDEYTTADGETFTDLHEHETYQRTVAGILTQSSNTGTIQIGQTVSDEDRYQTMKNMGLGKLSGIELPGESAGILSEPSSWDGRSKYTTMFGQAYAITAVQEAAIMATVANGGVYQAPRLVDGITDASGEYHEAESPAPEQAISSETAQQLLTMMESVSTNKEYGTGQAANVEGYRLAIKTGTSEIAGGGTVATVAGIIPADNPALAIAVVLYNPRAGVLSSDSAAPLFREVATAAVQNLGIPASSGQPDLYPIEP